MYVLIGDIVNSRKLSNRYEVQEMLKNCLTIIKFRFLLIIQKNFEKI